MSDVDYPVTWGHIPEERFFSYTAGKLEISHFFILGKFRVQISALAQTILTP